MDTNGNDVTWASVDRYKGFAMEKSGDGTLNLGAAVYTNALTVNGGIVSIASGEVQTRFSAGISVSAGVPWPLPALSTALLRETAPVSLLTV